MIEQRAPKYQWGQRVTATQDLYNDGSFPEAPPDSLLARAGDTGEIVRIGTHVETSTLIYLVEFAAERVVGCLEEEILPAWGATSETTTITRSP